MNDIPLRNGKIAKYTATRYAMIKEMDPVNQTPVYLYEAPCPLCEHQNPTYSYDGKVFMSNQITCRNCGIFYRPMIDPESFKKSENTKPKRFWNEETVDEDRW